MILKNIKYFIMQTMMWGVHPEQDRFLNAREYLHLMGLPHDFEIDGERSFNHIAQNVPTCTARDMALEVYHFIIFYIDTIFSMLL